VFWEQGLYGGVEDIVFERARLRLAPGGDRGMNRAPYVQESGSE
jgi:hypothetical protein